MSLRLTHDHLREQYEAVLAEGYSVLTCREYAERKNRLPERTLVNRVDIDFSVRKARRLVELFASLDIRATFFLRLHAPEYNPFSFENYLVVKSIVEAGHELGYHSEVMDEAAIWNEDAAECLRRDLKVLRTMFNAEVVGVASHGGTTPWNNLDFWKDHAPQDLGLLYEAYDERPQFNLFRESLYVSDSEWTKWKCYRRGELVAGDRRAPAEHVREHPPLVYMLIHSDTYYDRHFYENER